VLENPLPRRANGGDSSDEAARSRDARVITDDPWTCHRRHHRRDTVDWGRLQSAVPSVEDRKWLNVLSRTFRYREGASDLHRRIRRAFIRGAGRSRRLRPCRPAQRLGKIPLEDKIGQGASATCIGVGPELELHRALKILHTDVTERVSEIGRPERRPRAREDPSRERRESDWREAHDIASPSAWTSCAARPSRRLSQAGPDGQREMAS